MPTVQLEKSKIRSETESLTSVVPHYPTAFLHPIAKELPKGSDVLLPSRKPGLGITGQRTCLLSLSQRAVLHRGHCSFCSTRADSQTYCCCCFSPGKSSIWSEGLKKSRDILCVALQKEAGATETAQIWRMLFLQLSQGSSQLLPRQHGFHVVSERSNKHPSGWSTERRLACLGMRSLKGAKPRAGPSCSQSRFPTPAMTLTLTWRAHTAGVS